MLTIILHFSNRPNGLILHSDMYITEILSLAHKGPLNCQLVVHNSWRVDRLADLFRDQSPAGATTLWMFSGCFLMILFLFKNALEFGGQV